MMMRIGFRGIVVALALSAGSTVIAGVEGYWINQQGGYWWDAANWQDGVIPGRYTVDDGTGGLATIGDYGGTAYLGKYSWDWRAIQPGTFDGGQSQYSLVSISNVIVYANDFPKIGTSVYLPLYLEQGGGIYVLEACTKGPVVDAKVAFDSITDTRPLTFQNDAAGTTLSFSQSFGARAAATAWLVVPLRFGGKGSIEVKGAQPGYNNDRFKTDLFFTAPGRFVINGTFENTVSVRALAGYGKQTVEILDGKICHIDAGGIYDQACVVAQSDLEFTGDGKLIHRYTSIVANQTDMRLKVENGSTLTIATEFSSGNPNVAWVLDGEAGGVLKITGTNLFTGNPTLQGGAVFETAALGLAGQASPFGIGSAVTIKGGAALRYTGSGETTDRGIVLASSEGVLEQCGSGSPVFAGTVSGADASTLVLSNETEVAAVLSGSLKGGAGTPKLVKRGTGEWVLSGDALDAGEITVEKGTLVIDDPSALVSTRITVGAAGTLVLGGDTEPAARPAALTVYGTGCVKANWTKSLPEAGVSTPDGARVTVRMPDWSWQDVVSFANANPQTGWSAVSIDTSAVADGSTFALSSSDVTAATGFALGHEGGNTMGIAVGDAIANPVALVANEGTLKVTGAGSLKLAKALATSSSESGVGHLVLAGPAGGITLVDGPVEIGRTESTATVGRGEVTVTNVSVVAADGKLADTVITAGHYGQGVLRIDEGAALDCRINAGYGTNNGSASGEGAVIQSGGTVVAEDGLALGNGGVGYYALSGGSLTNNANGRYWGGMLGQGIVHQSGGEIVFPSTMGDWAVMLGMYGGFCGYQTGGTMTFNKRTYMSSSGSGSAAYSSYLTLAGAEAKTVVNDAFYMAESRRTGEDGPVKAVLNLNGGTFQAQAIGIYPTSVRPEAKAYVGFNGGTYVPTSPSPFGSDGGYPSIPTRVTVYEGGCVISNTQGATMHVPLSAPYGNSVTAVPVPEAIADRVFVAPPYIEIFEADGEGAGDGATACAFLDPASGMISRIEVTSAGWGYTRAVARFNLGPTVLGTSECTLGAVASGNLVKEGTHDLILKTANSYGGDTVVKGGSLTVNHDDALPATTRLRIAPGAMIDLNGRNPTVAGVYAAEGAVLTNGTPVLSGIAFDIAAPETMSSPTAVVFAEGAVVSIAHADAITESDRSFMIARFPAGWSGSLPLVTGLSGQIATRWRVAFGPTAIRLVNTRGTTLIFR